MSEPRSNPRKVTRKAGPPNTFEQAPTFQAPTAVEERPEHRDGQQEKGQSKEIAKRENRETRETKGAGNKRQSGGDRRGRGGRSARGDNNGQQGGQRGRRRGSRRNPVQSMQGADMTKRLPAPKKAARNALRIYALGGISEIGRNMTVFEFNDRLLIVDCGVLFPSSGEPGVDLILPDFGPIEDKLDKVEALVITHGHEDHIGAIPYLLRLRPDLPIIASRFTNALIAAKTQEHRQRPKLIEVNAKSEENRGPFNVRFWDVNHSIPDCLGIVIKTKAGTVVMTGDIKMDQTPLDGKPTDLPALSRYGDEGIDLMLVDSTNATVPGVSPSEAEVAPTLRNIITAAKQRVILASFASNVYRVQAAVDAAVAAGRKVAFTGRSMIRNMEIAERMGYLKAPRGTIITMDEAAKLAPHKVVLITTGTQGEPMAALSRMARREHRQITVREGDLIILSSSLVPGNEEAVFGVINMLAQIGAEVITGRDAKVHTSGHGYAGELLFLYNAARPRNVMPVHGEWRHIRANKALAMATGVPEENTVLAQNGVVVDLIDGRISVAGQVPVGNLYVDGTTMGEVESNVLEERSSLGAGGLVSITALIDNRTSRLLETPTVSSRGFAEDDREIIPKVRELAETTMNDLAAQGENDTYRMVQQLRRKVSRFIQQEWRREPMILPTVIPMTVDASGEISDDDVRATRESL